jgi:hypothetical protein
MKESHIEGLANHSGPESGTPARKGKRKAMKIQAGQDDIYSLCMQ